MFDTPILLDHEYAVWMSSAASQYLVSIGECLAAASSASPATWLFDIGMMSDVHHELEREGMIVRMLGTEHGFAWRLSDKGIERALKRG
jgi:hypothetical protein